MTGAAKTPLMLTKATKIRRCSSPRSLNITSLAQHVEPRLFSSRVQCQNYLAANIAICIPPYVWSQDRHSAQSTAYQGRLIYQRFSQLSPEQSSNTPIARLIFSIVQNTTVPCSVSLPAALPLPRTRPPSWFRQSS